AAVAERPAEEQEQVAPAEIEAAAPPAPRETVAEAGHAVAERAPVRQPEHAAVPLAPPAEEETALVKPGEDASPKPLPLRPPLSGGGPPITPPLRTAIPARPVPTAPASPRPGQILSGPRQPLPPAVPSA